MTPKRLLTALTVALIAGCLIAWFTPVSADGTGCGSAFSPRPGRSVAADWITSGGGAVADCDDRIDALRGLAVSLAVASLLCGGAVLAARRGAVGGG